MCGEVRVITVNYLVTCWGLGGAVLSGCVGVVVGMGVGACRWETELCQSFHALSFVFVSHPFESRFKLFE